MSKPISVGDLVMIVRWPHKCGETQTLGIVFTVESISSPCHCSACNMPLSEAAAFRGPHTGDLHGAPLSWLKRIPPLEELDDVKRDEEITA